MQRLERRLVARPERPALLAILDGRTLPIPLHSGDPHAGVGRGVGHIAKGYRINAVIDAAGRGLGHRRPHPARLRSGAILDDQPSAFGAELLRHRRRIERYFAWLTNFAGGLTGLPPRVGNYRRVHAWAKIILDRLPRHQRHEVDA